MGHRNYHAGGESMDFLPDKEFHKLFDRISRKVDLGGAGTPEEINARLRRKIGEDTYSSGRDQLAQVRARYRTSGLKKLIFAGFGRRVIDEAVADPHGEVALTLKHGRERAKVILLARERKRIRW